MLWRKTGAELDPQFRIATPDGDYAIAMTLSPDIEERVRQMRMVSLFMAWKMSACFTMASELHEPDAVCCCCITRREQFAAISFIERQPLRFSEPEWLPSSAIGDDVRDLLPEGSTTIDAAGITALEAYFGLRGAFPAVHIETGRIAEFA